MDQVVIIGNGIAGVTAARHIRKMSDKKIIIISSESKYFFSRTALMYVYMGHMKLEHTQPYENWFWEKNRIELIQDHVTNIDTSKQQLQLQSGNSIDYHQLIIATGSTPNKINCPGIYAKGVQGLYSQQDLSLLEQNAPDNKTCKRAVVVGGGLIGIELAEMLRSRDIPVTFLIRESSFWNSVLPEGESAMITKHLGDHHIDIRLNTSLTEIKIDGNGHVNGIITDQNEHIDCSLVGLTIGVSPNISFLSDTAIKTNKGILVNAYLETNIPHVFAIGDCAELSTPQPHRRSIEAVWYVGRMMGETVAQTICGNKTKYQPGYWFNSAKFLDIEYQTYGAVSSLRNLPDFEEQFHWKHPKENICITLAFHKKSQEFLGINAFGIRMRHEVCNQWLTHKKDITYVLTHLKDANFDPEFYTQYEKAIVDSFNKKNNTNIIVKKKSWARIFNTLLS